VQLGNLLLVMAHGDSVVKASLGRREALLALFGALPRLQPASLLRALRALKALTFDPALLQPLQVWF
jgi:hypothetical protein